MRLPLTLATLLAAAACGDSGAPPKGGSAPTTSGKPAAALLSDAESAEQAGDWKAVLACADGALADGKASAEEKQAAWLLKIAAAARESGVDGGKAAVKGMVAASEFPAASKLAALASDLAQADHAAVAVEVMVAADAKYGSDPAMKKQLKKIAKMCQAKLTESGDAGGLAQLQALGYLSAADDEEE